MDLKKFNREVIDSASKVYRSYGLNFRGQIVEDKGTLTWVFPPRYELLPKSDPVFDLAYLKLAEYHREFFRAILHFTANSSIPTFPFNKDEDVDLINDLIGNVYIPLIEEGSPDPYLVKGYHLSLDAIDDFSNIFTYYNSLKVVAKAKSLNPTLKEKTL